MSRPASRSARAASAWAASEESGLLSRLSACGAIVVTGRLGQLAFVSGRSKASKNG